jgi:hypothetical protein
MAQSLPLKLMSVDRRWIFVSFFLVCLLGYSLKSIIIPLKPSFEVNQVYDRIETLQEGDIIHLSLDYDPNSLAELHPMSYAILEQCFRKKVKVVVTTLAQFGAAMVDDVTKKIVDSVKLDRTYHGVLSPGREIVYGVDYVYLGYKPFFTIAILNMGQNYRIPYPTDYYGTPLDSLPMMSGLKNYREAKFVICITGSNVADGWLSYGTGKYNMPLALGLTGVSAAQYYPYLNSGQLFGMIGGLLGAAQYETKADNLGLASDGMRTQLFATIVIIAFIALGNVGFFLSRRGMK